MSKNDKFLENLYYGKIVPWERRTTNLPGGQELVRQIGKDHAYLDSVLSEADRTVLERMYDNLSRLALAEACASFKDGYRLGGRAVLAAAEEPTFDSEQPS